MDDEQTKGREKNGAIPGGKPEAATRKQDVKKVGEAETRSAGPDGPDAREIGNTFKNQ